MTYQNCKTVIEIQKQRGSLDKNSMMNKLDVFLLNGRITEDEYSELVRDLTESNTALNSEGGIVGKL